MAVRAMRAPRCFGVGEDHDQRLGGSPEQEVVDAACSGTQWRRFAAGKGEGDMMQGELKPDCEALTRRSSAMVEVSRGPRRIA